MFLDSTRCSNGNIGLRFPAVCPFSLYQFNNVHTLHNFAEYNMSSVQLYKKKNQNIYEKNRKIELTQLVTAVVMKNFQSNKLVGRKCLK